MNMKWMTTREFLVIVGKMKSGRRFPNRLEFAFRPHLPGNEEMLIDVASTDSEFKTTVAVRAGTSDLQNFSQVFMNGDYNFSRLANHERIQMAYAALEHPLILDLGANIGMSALYLTKNFPRAKIIAIEPAGNNVVALRRNVKAHPKIEVVHAAIASRNGSVVITNPDEDEWSYQTKLTDHGPIQARSVPSILADYPDHQPFICKIDIEGGEVELFSKDTDWLALFPVVTMELHDWLMPGTAPTWNFLKTLMTGKPKDIMMVNQNLVVA